VEPLVLGYCNDWFRGLIWPLSIGLGTCCDVTDGEVEPLLPVTVAVVEAGGPGRRPNLGNSNWKLTSLGLLTAPFPRPLPERYGAIPLFKEGLRPTPPVNENRLRYSRNSMLIFSICARKILFS